MADLNTQIILRNDTKANWENLNPVLDAGEAGVENDTGKFKIGDGTKTWKELVYAGGDEKSITDAIAAAEDKATVLIRTTEADDAAVLATLTNPSQGDIAVVKMAIAGSTDKFTHTGYVYDENTWKALDGNYSADNVYFEDDITVTEKVGTITLTNGAGTLKVKGKTVAQGFQTLLAQEKNPATTQPDATLKSDQMKSYEVGTSVTVNYSFSTTAGSYSYGPATGVTFSGYSATLGEETITGSSGSFTAITVGDSTNLTLSGKCSSTAGAIPKTNLGSDYASGQIAAKSYTPSVSTKLTGYRNWFWGFKTSSGKIADPENITSAQVRALGNAAAGSIGSTISTNGMQQMFVCIPAGKKTKVAISNSVNGAPCTVTKCANTIAVEGANKYTAANYDVWYVNNASADSGANTYKIVVS